MSQKISINGSLTVYNNGNTISIPTTLALTTSSSIYVASVANITSSWQVIDQNNNKDFRLGIFENTDLTQSIRVAIGNTGSYTQLWVNDLAILPFSGSPLIYAQTVTGTAQLAYTLVSMM
jgi:hypothetical protein